MKGESLTVVDNTNNSSSPWLNCQLSVWEPLICDEEPLLYRKKSYLYYQGHAATDAFIVKTGRVCITSYSMDGSEKQLYIAEQGCMTGESPCLAEESYSCSALAIVDSYIYRIPFAKLKSKMMSNWNMNLAVCKLVGRKNQVYLNQIKSIALFDSQCRIAKILLDLCDQYGQPSADGIVISIKFTHQDVAAMVGVSRVTVCNVFNMFLDSGILYRKDKYFSILNREQLEKMAKSLL